MKVFRIETEIKATKTIEYFIEANSEEEALIILGEGEVRGEGEEIDDDIDWGTEVTSIVEEMPNLGE
jgi:hypothetical protein